MYSPVCNRTGEFCRSEVDTCIVIECVASAMYNLCPVMDRYTRSQPAVMPKPSDDMEGSHPWDVPQLVACNRWSLTESKCCRGAAHCAGDGGLASTALAWYK